MVLIQDPTTFAERNGRPYNPPTQQPPTYPIINVGTITADQERLRAERTEDKWNWCTYNYCEQIYVKQMAKAIETMYCAELDDPEELLNGINIRTFFDLILYRYYDIGQTNIDNNIARFNQAISPSLPMAVYFHKQ